MICRLQERGSHSQTGMGEGPRRAHSASKERHWAGGRHTGACSLYILVCVCTCIYAIARNNLKTWKGCNKRRRLHRTFHDERSARRWPRPYCSSLGSNGRPWLSSPSRWRLLPCSDSTHSSPGAQHMLTERMTRTSRRTRNTENLGYKWAVMTWLIWPHDLAHFLQA